MNNMSTQTLHLAELPATMAQPFGRFVRARDEQRLARLMSDLDSFILAVANWHSAGRPDSRSTNELMCDELEQVCDAARRVHRRLGSGRMVSRASGSALTALSERLDLAVFALGSMQSFTAGRPVVALGALLNRIIGLDLDGVRQIRAWQFEVATAVTTLGWSKPVFSTSFGPDSRLS